MATYIIVGLLVLYIIFAFTRSRKRIKNGCCGGSSTPYREQVKEEEYSFHEQYPVHGMHCENCAARIERKLSHLPDIAAQVDLKKEIVHIYSNHAINAEDIKRNVAELGYELRS